MNHDAVSRRTFLHYAGAAAGAFALGSSSRATATDPRPNFVIIFADDLGYGDLACFGSEKHRTPNLDQMATEGTRFTSFYVTSGVCTPSRSSLMTGCYPRRVNMHDDGKGGWVLFPVGKRGLNPKEITIAEMLKAQGYATACIGKWHLGDQREFLPTRQGFDYYYGLPYSNDMKPPRPGNPPLPLLRNETVIEAPADQNTLTQRYTREAIRFIRDHRDQPFFVYLPHTMVHNPVHASRRFRGRSANGGYGDAVEEVDWSTGEILKTLRDLDLARNTLVVFTSDNGAASRWGGSNLPLSGWKGSTMEGGMREPCIMWWPGRIPAGKTCDEMAITMDLLPTFAGLAGTTPPDDRIIDGRDIRSLVFGQAGAKTPHEAFYYYHRAQLQAVRSGNWKLHLPLPKAGKRQPRPSKLVNLSTDIAEKRDVAAAHPDVVERLLALAEKARKDLGDGDRPGAHQRPAGNVVTPVPLLLPGAQGLVTTGSGKRQFSLKPGQQLEGGRAPQVAHQRLAVTARITGGRTGVVVAQGGLKVGYALYLQDGRPAFVVRRDWEEVTAITADKPLPEGDVTLEAVLEADGQMRVSVNGDDVVTGKAPGAMPDQPAEALSVGSDVGNAVGTYAAPAPFNGKITSVTLTVGKPSK